MVVFAVVSVPMAFINFGNEFFVLTLISKAEYLKTFDYDLPIIARFTNQHNQIKLDNKILSDQSFQHF